MLMDLNAEIDDNYLFPQSCHKLYESIYIGYGVCLCVFNICQEITQDASAGLLKDQANDSECEANSEWKVGRFVCNQQTEDIELEQTRKLCRTRMSIKRSGTEPSLAKSRSKTLHLTGECLGF